jgi:aminoglycoside phosphotransferase (APT) family kinase protein
MTDLRPDLRRWVEHETGSAIADATTIGSGSSRRTWGLGLADGRQLVLREDTGTGPMAGTPLNLAREAAVYRALGSTDLPVPVLFGVSPDATAMVLSRSPGVADLSLAGDADRAAVARDYLRCLGRLHLLDPRHLDLGPIEIPRDGPSHARLEIDLWQSIHATVADPFRSEAASTGLEWLRAHAPTDATRTSLCHGDAGPLNFLYERDTVTAMLDWEFAHVGDPHDDLAWVTVRTKLLRAGIDLDDAFAAWSAVTGSAVDPDRVEYYRVFVLVRMLISCDATVRWADGVETEDNTTQVRLRPHLSREIAGALS